jgi:hypothetical protein
LYQKSEMGCGSSAPVASAEGAAPEVGGKPRKLIIAGMKI